MKINHRLPLFVSLLLLTLGSGLLIACSGSASDNTSQLENRVATLETEVQANGASIAALQQQIQQVQQKVNALTPVTVQPTTPPTVTPTTPPTTPPVAQGSVIPFDKVVLSNLTVTPATADPGTAITVSVSVKNTSTVSGNTSVQMVEHPVPQSTPDVLTYSNAVTLNAGETKTVIFTTTKTIPGTYSVTIGALSGSYFINFPPAPPVVPDQP